MPGVETHLRQPDRRCQKTETVIQARRRYTPGVGYSGMTVLAFGALRSTCQSPKVRQRFRALRTRLRILGGIFHRIIVPLYPSVRVDPSLTAACVNIPHQRSGLGVSLPRQFPLTVLAIYFLHKQDGSFVPPPRARPPPPPPPTYPSRFPSIGCRPSSLLPCDVRCLLCTVSAYFTVGDFECLQCSFVYKPDQAGQGALQGTQFDDLPSSWLCPVCKAPKVRNRDVTRPTENRVPGPNF